MSDLSPVNVALVGAGAIFRSRHLPNLVKMPGVRLLAVSNRTPESARRVAGEFGVGEVVEDWRELLRRPDVDAVMIGTWPNKHREMSVAALEAGKHVFCQARMATDLVEARAMLAAARARPGLVNMVCPPPTRMPFEPFIRETVASGRLGRIVSIELHSASGANLNPDAVHWRERRELSGNQVLAMGIYAETLNAWVGRYERLSAATAVALPEKRDATGAAVRIEVPQAVTISGRLRGGALAVEHHMGLAADKTTPGDRLTVWGLGGTLRYGFGDTIELAGVGEPLRAVDVPAEQRRPWWVEEEFIAAVGRARAGQPWRVTPDFAEALEYMKKVEAVHRSSQSGREVVLEEL